MNPSVEILEMHGFKEVGPNWGYYERIGESEEMVILVDKKTGKTVVDIVDPLFGQTSLVMTTQTKYANNLKETVRYKLLDLMQAGIFKRAN